MKRCSTCRLNKELAAFTRNKNAADGRHNQCKACRKIGDAQRYVRHKPKLIARSMAWARRNPVAAKRHYQNWEDNNREYRLEYYRRYKRANREYYTNLEARRRAQKKTTETELICRREIWERDEGICYLCSRPVAFEIMHLDHVIPLSRKGPHTKDNVKATHSFCNKRKWAHLV